MPETDHLLASMAVGPLLNLTPGPDGFPALSNSLRGGWRRRLVAALGISEGCCVHVVAAAVGPTTHP